MTAWECDMAETYGVLDVDSIPLRKLATLSAGLREDSRIKMKLTGMRVSFAEYMQALIYDEVAWLKWSHTTIAHDNPESAPDRIAPILMGKSKPVPASQGSKYEAFNSGNDFASRWAELTKGEGNG